MNVKKVDENMYRIEFNDDEHIFLMAAGAIVSKEPEEIIESFLLRHLPERSQANAKGQGQGNAKG